MALRIYTGAGGSKFVCDDDGGFGDAVAAISIRANAPINSCAREEAAEPFLRELGKMSQKQLFDCAQAFKSTGRCPDECHGNCNPANPPGRSTHERFNDGVAYKHWPAFRRLPPWARGVDVERSRVPEFCEEARKEGFTVTLTYPGVAAEAQHVNFRKNPKISLWKFRPLKAGSKGPRVSDVVRRLWQLRDPQTSKPYLDPKILPRGVMTPPVVAAVKAFQRDHHQKDDGEVGIHTIRAMRAMLRVQQAKAGPVEQ